MSRAIDDAMHGHGVTREGVMSVLGGWRGITESVLPGIVFLAWFAVTQNPTASAIAPLAIAIIFLLVRVFRREPVMPALTGLLAVAVCVAASLFTGQAKNYYLPGFIINAVWIAALGISLIVRWPLIGLIGGALTGSMTQWRAEKSLFRVAVWCTVAWLTLFILRLAVQLPLYMTGHVEALGVARLAMGIPPYALLIVITWRALSAANSVKAEPRYEHRNGLPSSDE
jgi:hypothetical protein